MLTIISQCCNTRITSFNLFKHLSPLSSSTLKQVKPKKKTSPSSNKVSFTIDHRFDLLINYKKIHGDLFVPKLYRIPSPPSSSSSLWNSQDYDYKLGTYVQVLRRYYNKKSSKPKELEEIGFIWDVHHSRYLQIRLALLTYQDVYGDMLVPVNFLVPSNNQWDKSIHGLQLGKRVSHIRHQNQYSTYRHDLESIGFTWNFHLYTFQKTIRALKQYNKIHGNMNISKTYIIPKNSDLWPDELKGFELGPIVGRIRYDNIFEEFKDQLDLIGFVWRLRKGE